MNQYKFYCGGTNTQWVTGLGNKVQQVAEASNQIPGISFSVTCHGDPTTAEASLLQTVGNSTDQFEELTNSIQLRRSQGWLVLTENDSVFEKGYGRRVQETMYDFEEYWKKDVQRTKNFGQSFKDALRLRA